MKAPGIIWLVLLVITGLIFWLTMPQPTPARIQIRIRIEPDVISEVSVSRAAPIVYDPYFNQVNNFTKILIPASSRATAP
jgi:hypothetical protein